jgi:hypothetical protein
MGEDTDVDALTGLRQSFPHQKRNIEKGRGNSEETNSSLNLAGISFSVSQELPLL